MHEGQFFKFCLFCIILEVHGQNQTIGLGPKGRSLRLLATSACFPSWHLTLSLPVSSTNSATDTPGG